MIIRKGISYLVTFLLCCMSIGGYAATYYNISGSTALQLTTQWGTNTNGSGTRPTNFTTSGDIFNLVNGTTGTISGSWVITGVTLNVGNGSAMNLTIPSSFSLTGTGVVAVAAGATLTLQHTSNPTLGTLNATSTVNYNGTGAQTIAIASYSNLTISGARSGTPAITFPSGTVSVSGTFAVTLTGAVTYTTTSNTFTYSAATGGQNIISVIPYNNLAQSATSGTNTAGGNLSVAGVLTTAAGGTLEMGTSALSVTGSPANNGIIRTQNTSAAPITTGKSWGGTVNYSATAGGQTVMPGTYATLTISNTSGIQTAGGALTVNTALNTTAGGTLDMAASAMAGTLTTITNNGTITTDNTTTAPFTAGKTWGGTGVVDYDLSTGGQTIATGTYNCDLVLSNTSGTNTANGVLTINADITISAGGILSMSSFAMAGSPVVVTNNGTITTSATTNPALPIGEDWGAGTVTFLRSTGGQSVPSGTYNNLTLSNTSSTNTVVGGALTVNGVLTTTSAGTLAMAANQLLGTFTATNNGTISTTCTANPAIPAGLNWTGTTGRVSYTATTGGQFIPAGIYKTLSFSNTSGINTATGNLTVNTSITTSAAGGTLDMGTNALGGTLTTFTNTGTIKTQNTSSAPLPSGRTVVGTVNYYNPTGGQTIVSETSYTTLTLSNSSGTNTAGGALSVKTALNIAAGGTLNMTAAYRLLGTLTTITNNGVLMTSVPTSVSSTPLTTAKTWNGTGVVVYAATAGLQTIVAGTYRNITLANTSGTNSAGGVLTINGTLTTTSGGVLAMGSYAMAGTVTPVNNGTISTASITNPALPAGKDWTGTVGNVIFALTTGGQFVPAGTYQTLKFNNTSGTNTAVGAPVVTTSLITTSGGTFALAGFQLSGAMVPTNNGTITTTCTVNPAIPAGQTWTGTIGAVTYALTTGGQYVPAGTYGTLRFNNTSGTNTAVGDITNSGTLIITAGGTLDMGTANELNGSGTFTNGGTIRTSVPTAVSATPIPSGRTWTGTIIYAAAAGAQTVVDGIYTNLTLSNTSGTNTAAGDIIVNTGTMVTTAGGTLDMDATNILSGTGTFTNNGNIQTEVPVSLSATPIPAGKAWGGTITYAAAAGLQTIVSQISYNNLAVINTSDTTTSAANLVVNGTLTTGSGTVDLGAFTLSGLLTSISGGGTILTGNTSAAPIPAGKTWTQTIEYDNAAGGQTIVAGTYAGLTNSNVSGVNTVAASAAVSIPGELTLTAGSVLNDNGVTIALAGDILGSGTHTGSGAINMTGSGATISNVTLADLNLSNGGGFSLTGDVTINGQLFFSNGRLDIGTYNLTFGASAAAVSGVLSSTKMIVANGGGEVRKIITGTGSFLFPIGDNTPVYSPITLTLSSGSFAGGAYAAVTVTKAKHPQNANTTNYLNRYWTVNTTGVSSAVYNVVAGYTTGDVTGTEANISMGEYDGSLPWIKYIPANTSAHTLTATGVTSLAADFSGIATANPSVSVSPSSAALCSGGSVNLTTTSSGSPVLSYSWSPATGLSATTGSSVTAAPTVTTVSAVYVYTVSMTDGNGYVAIATSTVTVNPTPLISGNPNACVGLTSPLTANISGGTWTSSNTSRATVGSSSGVVTGVASGTVNITYTMSTGCMAVLPMTINAVPSAISGVSSVCAGTTTTLTESVPGGTWGTSDPSIATVNTSGIVTGVAGGSATISYTSGPSCFVTFTVTVGPIQPIVGNTNVCVGLTSALTNATSGGTWISSNTARATIGSTTGIMTGVSVGTATISYSLGGGCVRTTPISVNAVPSSITGTTNVCVGLTTTLGQAATGGYWSSSNTSVATVGTASGVVTGVAAGTVTISYISGASCYASTPFTVNALPAAITGTGTVCTGFTATLANTTGGGTWTSGATSVATIGSGTGVVSGVAAGTATITYTLPTGCLNTRIATVNASPASITGTANVCVGLTRTLTNSTGGGTWSSSATSIATVGTSGVVSGVANGSVTISYTLSSNSCFATLPFTVNPLPASISGTARVCISSTTTLSNTSGGGTWSVSNANTTIGSGTGVVTGVTAGTSVVTYTLPTGCVNTITATVNPLPAAIGGTGRACMGGATTLTDATSGGTWSSSNTAVATVGTSGIVSSVSVGNANITYTLATGCTAVKTVTVNSLPASISGASSLCDGDNTTLTNTTGGGTWSSSDPTTLSVGSSSGVVSAVSPGSANIIYTLSTGCSATKTVTVNDVPDGIDGAIDTCAGIPLTLSDVTPGGTWSSSNTSIATVGSSSGAALGISAGTAIITYTIGSTGCFAIAGLPVYANPAPITGTRSVCVGFTTLLSNATSGGDWSSANIAIADVDTSGNVDGIAAGTTVISYELPTGCASVATVTVNIPATLTGVSNNGPICAGANLTLSTSGASGVTNYSWSGPVAITSSTSSSASVPSATTTASGTYTVTVSSGTGPGCVNSYTTAATVNAAPTAAPTSNAPICTGASVSLSANPAGTTNTYTWTGGGGLSSSTAQNPTATPTVTTTYSLTVSYAGGAPGCSPSTVYTTIVSVNAVPTAAPVNNGPSCSGNSISLTANPGGSANTYIWSGANLSSTTAQNPTATPTVTTTYSLTVSYNTGRPGCSPSTVYTTTATVYPVGRWLGTVDTTWGNNSNWCGNVPLITTDVIIPTGLSRYPTILSGTYPSRNITIQSGTTVKVYGGTLLIAGTITNSGTFTATTGGIELNGSSAQSIPAGTFSGNTIKNLTTNNTAGVTLGGTLNISGILKATTGTFNTAGYITLLSTSGQTALIDGSGSGTVSGNVRMQRYLDSSYGYRYISSPFVAATVGQLSGSVNLGATFPAFYGHEENVNYAGYVIDTAVGDTIKPMRGYVANFGTSFGSSTFSLNGTVNNGSMSRTLYNNNRTYTLGYNLVGNPYPSPIDWNASSGWTKTNIDNAVYYFNHGDTNQYYGRYSSYVAGVSSDGTANNIIPAMQGFFVHVSNGSFPVTGTLGFSNAVRTTNLNPHYFRTTANDHKLVRIGATFSKDGKDADPAVVYFEERATNNFDPELDALKLINTDETIPSLYAMAPDGNKLSIQSLPALADSTVIVPLGLQTSKDGVVTFSATNIENIPADIHVWFYDTKTGKTQDMRSVPNYEINLAAGTAENRFFLMFSTKDISMPGSDNGLNAYASGSSLFVYLTLGKGTLVLTNMAGQVVGRQELSGTGYQEVKLQVSSGIYIATLYSDMGKQSKKILIGNQ